MWYWDDNADDETIAPDDALFFDEYTFPSLHASGSLKSPLIPQDTKGLDLSTKLRNVPASEGCAVCLFGTVPPRKHLGEDAVKRFGDILAGTLKGLEGLDGIVVYDIQDEEGRDGTERPFAYAATHEPRVFAKLLKDKANVDAIVYRTVPYYAKDDYEEWLATTWDEYLIHNLVLVGGSSSRIQYPGYSVVEASRIALENEREFTLGGIQLPERHRDKGTEHELLLRKTENGVSFFTSQVIYNSDLAIWLLRDYDELCKEKGKKPARLIFTFAPFGRPDTVRFLKWLGVEIPEGTEKRVLSRKTAAARVQESVDICRENLKRLLDAARYYNVAVPLGITVECVSKYKDEFEGSIRLFKTLQREMKDHERRNLELMLMKQNDQ